jgi:hypothetical protein
MKSLDLCPEEIVAHRRTGKFLPRERYGVVRFRGDVAYDNGFFWAFNNLDDAKKLCSFLATKELGAYVFDTAIQKKVFEMKVPASLG